MKRFARGDLIMADIRVATGEDARILGKIVAEDGIWFQIQIYIIVSASAKTKKYLEVVGLNDRYDVLSYQMVEVSKEDIEKYFVDLL